MRIRRADEIRYYIYRSSAKLDMLFNQLVASAGPFQGNVAFELGGFKASLGTSSDQELTDDEKWDVLQKELESRDLVGSPAQPREYFAGEMRMRWGLFDDNGERPADAPPLVFFGGVDQDANIVLGLGGSSTHVVGHQGASSTHSRSNTPAIVRWLINDTGEPPAPRPWDPEAERQEVLGAVGIALHYLRPPTQTLRFLARTLLTGQMPGYEHMTGMEFPHTVLGTPLYVMLTEHIDDQHYGLDNHW